MMFVISLLFAILAFLSPLDAGMGPGVFCPDEPFAFMAWSPDGRYLALGRQDCGTILLYDGYDKSFRDLMTGPASGFEFSWSPDGRRLGYKVVEGTTQKAMAMDIVSGRKEVLAEGNLVGQVYWLGNNPFFTIGHYLVMRSSNGERRWDLGEYVNQLSVCQGRRSVAYCQGLSLLILELDTGQRKTFFKEESDLFSPHFSPDGSRVLLSRIDGEAVVVGLLEGRIWRISGALYPSWMDDARVIYTRKSHQAMSLVHSGIYVYDLSTGKEVEVPAEVISYPGRAVVGGDLLAVASLGEFVFGLRGFSGDPSSVKNIEKKFPGTLAEPRWRLNRCSGPEPKTSISGWMPYIHQVYDTPDDFNGSAACGPTSCMMAIGFYHRYAVWNDTVHISVNPPGTHVSPYGKYDCRIYTYGGYTFSDTCSPPTGPPAYGAYGYCCTHNAGAWAYKCRDYIRKHDLSSDYDLSVSWSDITTQIDQGYPVVLSTAITSAGHLMCVRGYVDGQHTIIVNDPAGNRNNGPYWNYPGDNAYYDWPGYNNGYVNINSASWLVTAQGKHTRLALADFPDSVDAGHYYTITFIDTTSRYQTNNTFFVDVCDASSGEVVSSGSKTGLNDSLGGIWNIFNLTAPRNSTTVYFKSYLTPAGGSYDTRYISAWTNSHPTVVKPVVIRDNLINSDFESGLWPWADTENADLLWDTLSHSGARSLRLVPRVLTDYVPAVAHQDVRVVPGQNYVFCGWARKNDGCSNNVRLALIWYGADDVQIGSQVVSSWLSNDDPQFKYLSTPVVSAPAGAAYACLRLYVQGFAPVGDNFDDLYFGDPSGVSEMDDQGLVVRPTSFNSLSLTISPNPLSQMTNIRFQIPREGQVSLKVYNTTGQCVKTLISDFKGAGCYKLSWDGRDERRKRVAPGIYFCRLSTEQQTVINVLTVLR